MRYALHQVAIAGTYAGVVVDDPETGAIELLSQHPPSHCDGDRCQDPGPVALWCFYARRFADLGMPRGETVPLAKPPELLLRQSVASHVRQAVEGH